MRQAAPLVLPSLLAANFGNLEREIRRLEESGAKALHLDIMDGVFVPNLTFGMLVVEGVRQLTDLLLDVHLMIQEPGNYVDSFVSAGADFVSFHVEAVQDPAETLGRIRDLGVGCGVALNPATPVERIESVIGLCDLVLVMSVPAGFGGQQFDPIALDKLEWLRDRAGDEVLLEVDGGINTETIRRCANAGAKMFVAGSAVFSAPDYRPILAELTALARVK